MKNSGVSLGLVVANIAAIGLTLNVLPAFAIELRTSNSIPTQPVNSLSIQQIAQTCRGRYYRTVSDRQIEEVLNCMNVDYIRQRSGVYLIDLNLNGSEGGYRLTIENCSRRSCRIKLFAGFVVERFSRRSVSQWNADYRGTSKARASFDRMGYPVVQSYLSLRGGIESDEIADFIEDFENSLEDFVNYMGFSGDERLFRNWDDGH